MGHDTARDTDNPAILALREQLTEGARLAQTRHGYSLDTLNPLLVKAGAEPIAQKWQGHITLYVNFDDSRSDSYELRDRLDSLRNQFQALAEEAGVRTHDHYIPTPSRSNN